MRKLAFLLVGMMVVGGVVFGEEAKKEEKKEPAVKWNFSGSNVEYTFTPYDSQRDDMRMGDDDDLILKLDYQKNCIYIIKG